MPSRAHCLWQFNEGSTFIPSATISVYEPGTTNLIADTIYANDDPDTSVLPNPFTSDASGFASFFLEDARRVDVHMAKTGFTSQTIPSLDVTFPANRFTFRGAYSAVTAYDPDDVVTYGGATWINLTAATGTAPTEGATWSKMAAAGDLSPTIADAKGDLIVATAADTMTRLAVGAEGTIPVSRAAASTGIAWESSFDGAQVTNTPGVTPALATSGVEQEITGWNAERFDTGNYWTSGAPERLTVPRNGIYRISACVGRGYSSGGASYTLSFYKNGSFLHSEVMGQPNASTSFTQTISATRNLVASDYITVKVSAVWSSVAPNYALNTSQAFFQIEYLGV